MNPKFLVAKYAPNVRRMEPRNIGVIAWTPGRVAARFLGETRNGSVSVHAPRFVEGENKTVYRMWLKSWRELLGQESIDLNSRRRTVTLESPEYLDAVRESARGNYILADGGFALDNVAASEVESFAEYLFDELVAEPAKEEAVATTETQKQHEGRELRRAFTAAVDAAGLSGRRDYHQNTTWACRVGQDILPLDFDGMIHEGKPKALLQKVSLFREESILSTAMKFRSMRETQSIAKESCLAFYFADEAIPDDDRRAKSLRALRSFGNPVNLVNIDSAVAEIRRVAA